MIVWNPTSSDFNLFARLHRDRKVRLLLCFSYFVFLFWFSYWHAKNENSKNISELHFSCSVFGCAKRWSFPRYTSWLIRLFPFCHNVPVKLFKILFQSNLSLPDFCHTSTFLFFSHLNWEANHGSELTVGRLNPMFFIFRGVKVQIIFPRDR